jgi:hypothetical protein
MKTSNLQQVENQRGGTERTAIDKMEAIAYGVQARFEENTGYSRRVTDATITVARALGVPETEIERWAAHRLTRLARDTERLREIKSLLEKLYGNSLGAKTGSMWGMRYQPSQRKTEKATDW